jgi:hypothetical protein
VTIDWPRWARVLIPILIGLIIVVLALLFLPDAQSAPPPEELTKEFDEKIIMLEHEAVDEAFRDSIRNVFIVWMRDEHGQPGRAITGARQARSAYIRVMQALQKREESLPKK